MMWRGLQPARLRVGNDHNAQAGGLKPTPLFGQKAYLSCLPNIRS